MSVVNQRDERKQTTDEVSKIITMGQAQFNKYFEYLVFEICSEISL